MVRKSLLQRKLLLDGVVRYQHQASEYLVADLLTKDLGKILHKRHREVGFGRQEMQIVSRKLPESNKVYARRHNDELALNAKALRLAQAFKTHSQQPECKADASANSLEHSANFLLAAIVQALK